MAGSNQSMISLALFLPRYLRSSVRVLLALIVFVISAGDLSAQRRHGPSPLDTLGKDADQELGWEVLKRFRAFGVASDHRFRFQLKIMPRRESTTSYSGLLLGAMSDGGLQSRVDVVLQESQIADDGSLVPARVKRLLLQNGIFANAFELDSDDANGIPQAISSDRYFEPIVGSDFTVFDLLMPYTFWQKFYYEGRTTHRGRPSHVLWLYPPDNDELMRSKVSGVRVFLDEEFSGPIQVEVYDSEEEHIKTMNPVGLKKVDGWYIPNQIDVRNEKTRDKTRFKIIDADLNLNLPKNIFTPEGLVEPIYGTELSHNKPGE